MIILAGLPPATHGRAIEIVKRLRPSASALGIPSPTSDHGLYSRRLVDSLLNGVTGFAIRRRTRGPQTPVAPRSIILLYVPASDQERLLQALDFTVLPEPMTALAIRDTDGKQLRHSSERTEEAIAAALRAQSRARASLALVKERISRLSDREAILLPPRNFISEDGPLASKFVELRRGVREWSDRFPDLVLQELTHDKMSRIPKDQTRRAFVDRRSLAFLVAHPTAYDGAVRQIEEDASSPEQLSVLRSLYRFGVPLPSGFHHDAQLNDGSKLDSLVMECADLGPVLVSGKHANVYPNDFIRAKRKQKI